MGKKWIITGIVCILLGIILGAFGAHGLKKAIVDDPDFLAHIASYETGVRYQIYSGFSFLLIGLNIEKFQFSFKPIYTLWLLGTLFFSGSIYFLSMNYLFGGSLRFLGPVTPIGGLLLIMGWTLFLLKYISVKK